MSTVVNSAAAAAAPAEKPRLRDILATPKMVAIMVLGAASGFPNQITESAMQAWLKESGVDIATIGLLTYVSLPYLLRFLWAPLLDRYPLPFLGRRRGWMLVTQIGTAAAIAVFAVQEPTRWLTPIAICALVIVFFSATQDIVIDAYRADVAQPNERGLAAAANNLGYRTTAWLASAFALIVADWVGWKPAFLILAIVMLLFCLATALAPEPHYSHQPPRTLQESVVVPLRELLATPSAVAMILLVVLFKLGDAFALRLFTPFMMDVGFSKTEIAVVLKAIFVVSAVVGAVLGGIFMVRLGLLRSMLIFGVLQTASNFLYYALALTGKNYALMVVAVGVDNVAGAMGNIASVALMMALCDARYSAFQYALLAAFALTPRYALGGPAGWIAQQSGWDGYYIVSVLLALPGLILVWIMREKIKQLDQPRD